MNNDELIGAFDRTSVQSPQQIISSFFLEYTIEDIDYFLWLMLKSTLTSEDELWDIRQNRDDLIFRYESMLEFIRAVYTFCNPKHISTTGFNLS